ncbi:hypothetical protein BCV72DRAFT_304352 [Rhizopus microsporus var. microsporus]|uniref:Uncharacterized protein n=2 Tax=Rhizopus microsporus TaxID=58291 RepID=A0A2G4SEI5_RHIZD|nr:uncharacterized protein RHIMIDRAFT_242926 [Rhizopus microsporus ATCC 52813]XP_023460909.1 uncharacterized protein RHIMIDRAFT_242924 [Rhizopus microsporus ATCC 52813]ORE07723.1 hypothetical protein BCV72DRAFT_304352 [Rhizopus microsporus var. microsporus]PHZ07199.1 hypothetical protein RHIMIDRAFT_242926 [Rhizopus microsporus ATCC 52813]PHZ07201.1 hypothetical protein RHIMIDRAFT_242924 [Rhizopus microsporus ATCC 52813]
MEIPTKPDKVVVSANLPLWKIYERIWKLNAESYDSFDNFLSRFEDILEVGPIDIGENWSRLISVFMHQQHRYAKKRMGQSKPPSSNEARYSQQIQLSRSNLPSKAKAFVNKNASNNVYCGYYDS